MSRIAIHQDLYGYERTRKGFTTRQLLCMAAGVAVIAGMVVLLAYVCEVPMNIAVFIALIFGIVPVCAGWAKIWGLPAEVWATKLYGMSQRGNTIAYAGDELEPMEGELTREYIRKKKKRAYEAQ